LKYWDNKFSDKKENTCTYLEGWICLSVADNATGALLFMFLLQVKDKMGKKTRLMKKRIKRQILK